MTIEHHRIMSRMSSLESKIDGLYQGPLESFVAARTALAKTLTGDEARRVKQLHKPTATAWAATAPICPALNM